MREDGLGVRATARKLGVTPKTVRQHIAYGMAKLSGEHIPSLISMDPDILDQLDPDSIRATF